MNLKGIFVVLLVVLFLTSSISIAFAKDVSVGDISFSVPGNFTVDKSGEDSCILKDGNYTISIVLSEASDSNITKNSRMQSGFDFLSEDSFNSTGGISVYQQNFARNESYFSYYTFDVGDESYLIVYKFPVHDDLSNQNRPVHEIIDSIQ